MADLTWFYKNLLRRILELMECGMAGRCSKSVGERKNLFVNGAGTFGLHMGRTQEYHKQAPYRVG